MDGTRGKGVLLLAAVAVSGTVSNQADPGYTKPHIFFLMMDDVGSMDVGWADDTVKTPTLTALANQGVMLSTMYTWHWCAPSRTAFLTGRYPPRHGYEAGGDGPDSDGTISVAPLRFPLLPQTLKTQGYRTVMTGKYHLGYATHAHLPENRGFDQFLGYLTGAEDHYTHVKTPVPACPTRDLWRGGKGVVSGPANESKYFPMYSTFIWTEFLVSQIEQAALDPSTSLFVYAAYQNAHDPLEVPAKYLELYTDQGYGVGPCADVLRNPTEGYKCTADDGVMGTDCYCNRLVVKAMVSALDDGMKNVTDALKAAGFWDSIVFVAMGDNGGPSFLGHSNAPLRGGKLNMFEGGIRPACFIYSPLLPQSVRGTWFHGMAHETDWFETFAFLAGIPSPPPSGAGGPTRDGVNLWPALTGATNTHRTEVLIADWVLRVGDYKLIAGADQYFSSGRNRSLWRGGWLRDCMLGDNGGWMAPPTNQSSTTTVCPIDIYTRPPKGNSSDLKWRCPEEVGPGRVVTAPMDLWLCSAPCTPATPCLFDLAADPLEKTDVASSNPTVVAAMMKRLSQLQATYVPPEPLKDNGKFCTVAASRGGFLGPWLD